MEAERACQRLSSNSGERPVARTRGVVVGPGGGGSDSHGIVRVHSIGFELDVRTGEERNQGRPCFGLINPGVVSLGENQFSLGRFYFEIPTRHLSANKK